MAEVKQLKGKRTTAKQKLTVTIVHLENVIAQDNGRVPTEQVLTRQETVLMDAWEAYDTAHALYVDLLEEEAAEGEMEGYQTLYDRHHDLVGKVEEMIAKRRGLVPEPVPEVTNETMFTGAKVKRKCAYDRAGGIAQTVHDYFASTVPSVLVASIKSGLQRTILSVWPAASSMSTSASSNSLPCTSKLSLHSCLSPTLAK